MDKMRRHWDKERGREAEREGGKEEGIGTTRLDPTAGEATPKELAKRACGRAWLA